MKCINCGAPLGNTDEVCAYCETVTPYGESIRNEVMRKVQEAEIRRRQEQAERERKTAEKISRIRKTSIIMTLVLYVITFGYYSPYWYCSRSGFINLLSEKHKLPLWLSLCYAVVCAAFFFLPGSYKDWGMTYESAHFMWSLTPLVMPVMSAWMAFRVRKILRDYAEKYIDMYEAENIAAPSGLALFVFGPLYLQYSINRMIDANIFTPDNKL